MVKVDAFTLAPSMLVIEGHQPIEKWEEAGRVIFGLQRSVYWWIGDFLKYGEAKFGDDIYQAIDDNVSLYLLNRCAAVSREFAPDERNMNLSWTHHQALCGLKKPMQRALLVQAEENHWDSRQMREHIARMKGMMP